MITGSASSGSAAVVPSCSPVEAVSAAVARPASNPALRSMSTANGVGAPGTIRPAAFPASCAQAIGNLALDPSAIRSSSHKHTKLAASQATARTAKGQSRCDSDRHDAKTEASVGSSTYSETAASSRSTPDLTCCRHARPPEEAAWDSRRDDLARP